MSVEKLAKIIAAARYPSEDKRPNEQQYSTWPLQADLIYRGDVQGLREWQAGWNTDPEEDTEADIPRPAPKLPFRAPLFVSALVLLLLALVALLVAAFSDACGCVAPPPPPVIQPPIVHPLAFNLPTDTVFDYNRSAPYGAAQDALLTKQLSDLFSRFTGIVVTKIDAHTDPIGDGNGNKALGIKRAQSVLDRIRALRQDPKMSTHFDPRADLPGPPTDAGPNRDDAQIWHDCFDAFQVKQDASFKPLDDLRPEFNPEGRPLCSTALSADQGPAGFPACRAPYQAYFVGKDKKLHADMSVFKSNIYIGKAENFRELTSCLAPMRHVQIMITYSGQVAIPNSSSPSHVESIQ